jgi:hypothetical protein
MLLAPRQTFWDRLIGVLALRRPTYDAIRFDPAATTQVWWIVLLGGLFSGIGSFVLMNRITPMVLRSARPTSPDFEPFRIFASPGYGITSVVVSILGAIIGLFVISWLLRRAGQRLSNGAVVTVTNQEMRRLVGWSLVPSIVGSTVIVVFLALVPIDVESTSWSFSILWIVLVIPSLWWLAAINFAVRAAFDFSGSRALGTMALAWLYAVGIFVLVWVVLAIIFIGLGAVRTVGSAPG